MHSSHPPVSISAGGHHSSLVAKLPAHHLCMCVCPVGGLGYKELPSTPIYHHIAFGVTFWANQDHTVFNYPCIRRHNHMQTELHTCDQGIITQTSMEGMLYAAYTPPQAPTHIIPHTTPTHCVIDYTTLQHGCAMQSSMNSQILQHGKGSTLTNEEMMEARTPPYKDNR